MGQSVAHAIEPMDKDDFGVSIEVELELEDYDPAGADFFLEVDCDDAVRPMTFDAPSSTATYVTVEGDFDEGLHRAQVRATKPGESSIRSERFFMEVTP